MFNKNLINDGFSKGLIKLGISDYDGTVCCEIGEHSFFFGHMDMLGYTSLEKFTKDYTKEDIVEEILDSLVEMQNSIEFEDEAEYYESYLKENLYENDIELE